MKTYIRESVLYICTVMMMALPASPVVYGVQWFVMPVFGRGEIGYPASAAICVGIVGAITLVRLAMHIRIDLG
jgi:hypothetical protein